jgi:hypothetical protein
VSEEPEDWRWANAEGVIEPITEWKLAAWLSSGRIAAHTLVWRSGWAEWMPAARVSELVAAIPELQRERPVEPKRDATRSHPPPLPAGNVKPKPVGNLSRPPPKPPRLPPRRPSTAPAPPTSRQPLPLSPLLTPMPLARISTLPGGVSASEPRAPSGSASAMPDARAPIPTLVEMPDATATGTLRPPGAVPPPPRAVPPTPRNFEVLDELPELTPTALDTPIPSSPDGTREASKGPTSSERITQRSAAPTPIPVPDSSEVITERDAMRAFRNRPTEPPTRARSVPTEAGAEATRTGASARGERGRDAALPRRYSLTLFALGILAGLLAVTVIVLLASRRPLHERSAQAARSSVSELPTPPLQARVPGCQILSPAEPLSRAIQGSVPPHLTPLPGTRRISVGFAENETNASGMVFELPGLQVARMFARASRQPLAGVVPVLHKGDVNFILDTDDGVLHFPRTVAADPPLKLGFTDAGLEREAGENPPELVWPGASDEQITEMRVATLPGTGHALTYRRGGQSGSVLFGWLEPDGRKKSELVSIAPQGGLSGTPTIAENGKSALIAYAWRPNTDVYWAIQLAQALPFALPTKSVQFAIPPGGAGAEAISPAVTGLPGARWLLQWTEGSAGARQVRAQVMSADLSPVGSAFTLSRRDQNAGQGALASQGELALALFLVSKGRGHELWGASLRCPQHACSLGRSVG